MNRDVGFVGQAQQHHFLPLDSKGDNVVCQPGVCWKGSVHGLLLMWPCA